MSTSITGQSLSETIGTATSLTEFHSPGRIASRGERHRSRACPLSLSLVRDAGTVGQCDILSSPILEGIMNEASLSPLSTLIVDDSVNTAASLAMLVEGWGHRAMVAHDGPSALQLAGENSFDVVFLDVGMPQMTGWDLAQRLRQLPTTADAYLVVISGYGQDLNKVVSQAAGCDLHLVKPTEPEVLRVLLSSRQRAKQAQGSRA